MRRLLSISEFPIFRQNNKDESAEFKIAKVAVTNVLLWACIWTPYAFVVFLAGIGSKSSITPLVSQLPSFFAKVSTSINLLFYFVTDTPGK
jgi:r-opsin